MTQQLYRFYDKQGTLLYVGVTLDPPARFRAHRQTQDWWESVANVEIAHFPDRAAVLEAERDAIKRESPRWNIQHAEQRVDWAPDRMTWRCDACGDRIVGGEGYIHVNYADIRDYEVAYPQFRRELAKNHPDGGIVTVSLAEFDGEPLRARWAVHHAACDSDPGRTDYWIDVGRWATARAGYQWIAHLLGKTWIVSTYFDELMERCAYGWRRAAKKRKGTP